MYKSLIYNTMCVCVCACVTLLSLASCEKDATNLTPASMAREAAFDVNGQDFAFAELPDDPDESGSGGSDDCDCFIKFTGVSNLSFGPEWILENTTTGIIYEGNSFGVVTPTFSSYSNPMYFPLGSLASGSNSFTLQLSNGSLPVNFELRATVTCVTGSDGVNISTGAFANSYSLVFRRGTATTFNPGPPAVASFSLFFSCDPNEEPPAGS